MGLAVDHGRIGELGEVNSSGEQDQEGRGARRVRCICPLALAVVLSPSAARTTLLVSPTPALDFPEEPLTTTRRQFQ